MSSSEANMSSDSMPGQEVEIRLLQPGENAAAFRSLNEEWITQYFTMEARDSEILGDPESAILRKGGSILMAYSGGEAVGCVALIPLGKKMYELSKMAVAPHSQGHGLGRRLLFNAIAQARQLGATSLCLSSNTRLTAAIHLYESVGFRHMSLESIPPNTYNRVDVFMQLSLAEWKQSAISSVED